MKHVVVFVMSLVLACSTVVQAQDSGLWGSSALPFSVNSVKVNPYAQVGFQCVGANINLPVAAEQVLPFPPISLEIDTLDIALKDANFWSGTVGLNVIVNEIYSGFLAAGGILGRNHITEGTLPVSLGPGSTSAQLEFTNSKVESWFVQAGVGLGPALFGLYWDHFAFEVGDPRNQNGPLANQTLRGDVITKTFAPFIGAALPAGNAMLMILYSPLAYSRTTLALRSSQGGLTELEYSWNKPGNLVAAMFQYNQPLTSSTSFGIWGNYSWMQMRQNADLELNSTNLPAPRTKEVTATLGKYVIGGGIGLGVTF